MPEILEITGPPKDPDIISGDDACLLAKLEAAGLEYLLAGCVETQEDLEEAEAQGKYPASPCGVTDCYLAGYRLAYALEQTIWQLGDEERWLYGDGQPSNCVLTHPLRR